jgi:hypothetical protein
VPAQPNAELEWEDGNVTFDLYAWKSPRDLDPDEAEALVESWRQAGGDPATSPFEPSEDIGWFYRELSKDVPDLQASSDAVPSQSKAPIWLATTTEAPARVVGIRLSPDMPRDAIDEIYGLATKYDLVLYDPHNRRVHQPLEDMAEYASATFWPRGAVQASVAGLVGGAAAVVAWMLGIPVISGVVALGGGFMFVMAVWSLVHKSRKAIAARRGGGASSTPPG